MKTLIFYTDPGHGWLAVPNADLHDLGIAGEISALSYRRGSMAFLEEDCDLTRYVIAWEKRHGRPFPHESVQSVHTDGDSPIRSYQSFAA